ncbi:outer membrane beta-barrel protein [Spongiivirga sp. MCCC 1A20706]|uniref:outer membrane beta-barrel protein n=1 Tax=Spongiivirga sp. MCCC 1A20706 TaxID=3160963 RepID=UPI003977D62B
MKKLLLLGTLCAICSVSAQKKLKKIQFGISSGVLNVATTSEGIRGTGLTDKDNFTGFYLGPMVQLSISNKFGIQGEVLYGNANSEGFIMVPIQARIGILPKLSLLLGPQANYSLEDALNENFTQFAVDGVGGIAFNITRKFMVQARYAVQITDRSKEDQFSLKNNSLNIGIGYNF